MTDTWLADQVSDRYLDLILDNTASKKSVKYQIFVSFNARLAVCWLFELRKRAQILADLAICLILNRCFRISNRCCRISNRCYRISNRCCPILNRCCLILNRCFRIRNQCCLILNRCCRISNRCCRISN